jgi:hypothetical protein
MLHSLLRWVVPAGTALLLLATAGYAQRPPTQTTGMARVWFYRDMAPYSSLATPFVRLNGVVAGVSQPGGASYRDVPPGHYHISVDSYGVDFGQTKDVDLAPGAEIYAKVVSNDNWIEGGGGGRGGGGGYHRNTFYVWLYPAEQARPIIAQSWFYGGGPLYASLAPR